MRHKILLVDDDVRVVTALQRSLWKVYSIETAGGASEALEAISRNTYAVVVSDLKMPQMDGIQLLQKVQQSCPDTVRILLTGYADLDSALAAVNQGNVFRFLTKPCSQELLTATLDAALAQYRLVTAEKELLQQTLMGTVAALVGVLSTVQPLALSRASRIAQCVRHLASELNVSGFWEIEIAAMLSQVGCISLKPEILKKYYAGEKLSETELAHVLSHALIGSGLIRRIPRLHSVARIIEGQYGSFIGISDLSPEEYAIALGAQVLRVAIDYDRLLGMGLAPGAAMAALRHTESQYNPEVLAALQRMESRTPEWRAAVEDRDSYFASLLQQVHSDPAPEAVSLAETD